MSLAEFQMWCTGLLVAGALSIIALERRFPYRRQRFFRKLFWTDFFWYSLVHSYLLGIIISWIIAGIDQTSGLSRLRLISDWPLYAQFLLFFVTHDLYIYWFHRLQHHSPILWRTHEAHHSTEDVDWVAGSRSHAIEILINQTIEFAPIALLGAAPEVAVLKGLVDAVWGMWIHGNVNVRTGWLQYLINGPEMHRWHHSSDIPPPGVNFATKIAAWDWIFGTAHLPKAEKVERYGLIGREQEVFPGSSEALPNTLSGKVLQPLGVYLRQHVFAFRPLKSG